MISTCNRFVDIDSSSEIESYLLQRVYRFVDSIQPLSKRIVGRLSDSPSPIFAMTSHHFSLNINEDKYLTG